MPRNAASDPPETLYKEMAQCQHCYRSRAAAGSLSRCSGCKIAWYCSKECQKAGWPAHKERCQFNQRQAPGPEAEASLKALRAFTSKHRPTLYEAGRRALDLCVDPSRRLTHVLVVIVVPRPDSTRTENAYIVVAADVVPLDFFGRAEADIRASVMHSDRECHRAAGEGSFPGAFTVVLMDKEHMHSNAVGMGFGEDVRELMPGMPWKETMMDTMNAGRIL